MAQGIGALVHLDIGVPCRIDLERSNRPSALLIGMPSVKGLMPRLPPAARQSGPADRNSPVRSHRVWIRTPGTQPRTSLTVFAGPFFNAVSGTTSTPPGVR